MLSTKKLNAIFELEELKKEMDAMDEHVEIYDMLYENKYGKQPK